MSAAVLMVLATVSFLAAPIAAGWVSIFDTGFQGDGHTRYYIGAAQRCYSFSCWSGEVSYISFNRMPHQAWMTFFELPGCQGKSVRHFGDMGHEWFRDSHLDNSISSMMVLESGTHPTRGTINLCPEERVLLFRNASDD